MREVIGMARDEIVEPDDRMAFRKKAVAEVRAEKAGGSRDQNSHAAGRPIES